ncbi:hypothetical protein [Staphylococcus equorum]|uniref:hypothetical protein n=1 Tax=Staphylococcus equorum TaxID=246432 RepID=UPI003CEE2386
MVNVRLDKHIYMQNSVYQLTEDDIKKLQEEYTPIGVVQGRVDAGWDIKDAIRLNKRFVIRGGEFKARIRGGGKMAYLSERAIEDFREQGVTFKILDRRLIDGTDLLKDKSENETVDWKALKLEQEDKEREERKIREKKEKAERQEKARLNMIKKARCSSRWFKHLATNNKVARLKQDVYGKTQLI